MSSFAERADDIVRAVRLLRQHGMAVGFPMQTADGEIIFSVGKDFTLTADQILELLRRGELHAEGVRRSVGAGKLAPINRAIRELHAQAKTIPCFWQTINHSSDLRTLPI